MMRFTVCLLAMSAFGADWSAPVEVRHNDKLVMTYRAKVQAGYLVVRTDIEPGWHTFVMDNEQRQKQRLKGKPSLGVEKSTEIQAVEGITVSGPWLQSSPKDFSKPEMRWFSWGFEQQAMFAAKAAPTGSGPARVEIKGQACAADICKNIDISLAAPVAKSPQVDELKGLIPVR